MNDLVFLILRVIVSIAGVIVAYYLVPLIKQAIEKAEDEKLIEFVKSAVYAAQQTLEGGSIKKKYVEDMIALWLTQHKITITADQIDMLIESAVLAMKQNIK